MDTEGLLDLRLNPERGISAGQRLKELSKEELEGRLIENVDEPYAHEIAWTLTKALKKGVEITTTSHLQQHIAKAIDFLA